MKKVLAARSSARRRRVPVDLSEETCRAALACQEALRTWTITEREALVAYLVCCGYRNSEIALQLRCSVHTVKTHVDRICGKLGLRGRRRRWALVRQLHRALGNPFESAPDRPPTGTP